MRLDIVTPSRRLQSVATTDVRLPIETSRVLIPGKEGEFEVLPGHAPFLALIGTGLLRFEAGGRDVELMVSGGFADIDRESVTVMCESAALAEEISAEAEQKSLQDMERKLTDLGAVSSEDEDFQKLRTEAERAASKLRLIR